MKQEENRVHSVKLLSLFMDLIEGNDAKAIKEYLEFNEVERTYAFIYAHKLFNICDTSPAQLRGELAKHEG